MSDEDIGKKNIIVTAYVNSIVNITCNNKRMTKVVCDYFDGVQLYVFESDPVSYNLSMVQGDPIHVLIDSKNYSNYKVLIENDMNEIGVRISERTSRKTRKTKRESSMYKVSFVNCILCIVLQCHNMFISVSLQGIKSMVNYIPLIIALVFIAIKIRKKCL